jgi:hypothetical protein
MRSLKAQNSKDQVRFAAAYAIPQIGTRPGEKCSSPQLPIKRAILNRLGNVVAGNLFRARQTRDGPRDFEDSAAGAI